jgi:hypothetical protein
MSYIGNLTQSVPFITDTFSGNASTVNFTLTRAPAGTASIAVFISGLYQPPTTYTLIADVISFVSAPANGTNNVVVLHIGNGSATQVPSEGSVTTNKILDGAVTAAKIASGVLPTATANSAAIYANGAFATANSAGSYANSAFSAANSAASYANSAFATANSAGVYANSAFTKANTDVTGITITSGVYGNATAIPSITLEANGRVSAVTTAALVTDPLPNILMLSGM